MPRKLVLQYHTLQYQISATQIILEHCERAFLIKLLTVVLLEHHLALIKMPRLIGISPQIIHQYEWSLIMFV